MMAAENSPKTPNEPVTAATVTKQRKKRKWDQPAECLISAGVAIPGAMPLGGTVVPIPGVAQSIGSFAQSCNASSLAPQALVLPQSAAVIIQKLNQPKTQDELIAREIVINDADPMVRYKLTKSQTQEEIHKCTGAVVITRGKYRPPNGLPDNEKPLYLHISAGAHLKEMTDRIKAVDRAVTMIEEMLKPGQTSQGNPLYTACVFLGFEPDPSANITARIRGPNDQYINHIMNVTGAMTIVRGRGSGCPDSPVDDQSKPLHIFISSNNTRSLEEAKRLAENLLDTICQECGASRVSSHNVYGAVPPPDQLLASLPSSSSELKVNPHPITCSTYPTISSPSIATSLSQTTTSPMLPGFNSTPQETMAYPHFPVTKGTSYTGYEGIYPQATPLQQVALALRQAPLATSLSTSTSTTSTTSALNLSKTSDLNSTSEIDRRPQRRKFQELPVAASGSSTIQNGCIERDHLDPGTSSTSTLKSLVPPAMQFPISSSMANGISPPQSRSLLESPLSISSMPRSLPSPPPPPRNVSISPPPFGSMPPPASTSFQLPARSMPPPLIKSDTMPPSQNQKALSPPKSVHRDISVMEEKVKQVPDTLLQLLDYGEEDDEEDLDGGRKELPASLSTGTTMKPFWAV